jgi:hypothetical protein
MRFSCEAGVEGREQSKKRREGGKWSAQNTRPFLSFFTSIKKKQFHLHYSVLQQKGSSPTTTYGEDYLAVTRQGRAKRSFSDHTPQN